MNKIIIGLLEDKIKYYSDEATNYYNFYKCHSWNKQLKDSLIVNLRTRSSYKRTLKEYKKICNFVMKIRYKEVIETYRKNPDKFIEDMCEIKLMPYQKILVNMWSKYHIK